jgi:hypothetical protein
MGLERRGEKEEKKRRLRAMRPTRRMFLEGG